MPKLLSIAAVTDKARGIAAATAQLHGTHTGPGGPMAPTGRSVVSDYAYVMQFDCEKIVHMTKIWNDVKALRGQGWA